MGCRYCRLYERERGGFSPYPRLKRTGGGEKATIPDCNPRTREDCWHASFKNARGAGGISGQSPVASTRGSND